MEEVTTGMTTVFSQVAQFFGETGPIPAVFSWITGTDVLPYFSLGITVSLVLFGVKVVRDTIWGA